MPRNVMGEFSLEAVPSKENVTMPSKEDVAEIRDKLCHICAQKPDECWLRIPFGEFEERRRNSSDPVFRPEDFEGRKKGVYEEKASGLGEGGLDLLGRYRFDNRMVTIYIDSCRKVEQWCDLPLDQLTQVVLVHELAHLMTHSGFGALESLPPHFWEYTAQCATYAYLYHHNKEALKVFKKLSSYQPFIYRTWESLKALHAPLQPKKFEELVKNVFSAFANDPLDGPVPEHHELHTDTCGYDD
jgi:hypothetical protein